jgi:hypothetical protein
MLWPFVVFYGMIRLHVRRVLYPGLSSLVNIFQMFLNIKFSTRKALFPCWKLQKSLPAMSYRLENYFKESYFIFWKKDISYIYKQFIFGHTRYQKEVQNILSALVPEYAVYKTKSPRSFSLQQEQCLPDLHCTCYVCNSVSAFVFLWQSIGYIRRVNFKGNLM